MGTDWMKAAADNTCSSTGWGASAASCLHADTTRRGAHICEVLLDPRWPLGRVTFEPRQRLSEESPEFPRQAPRCMVLIRSHRGGRRELCRPPVLRGLSWSWGAPPLRTPLLHLSFVSFCAVLVFLRRGRTQPLTASAHLTSSPRALAPPRDRDY